MSWSDGVLTAARTDTNVTTNLAVTASFAVDTVASQPPEIIGADLAEKIGVLRTYTYQFTAKGSQPMVWSLDAAPTGMTIDAVTGVVSWTPAASQLGLSYLVVRVSNAAGIDRAVQALWVADLDAPTAPVLGVSDVSRTRVTLNWTPATDNIRVAYYKVYEYVLRDGRWRWREIEEKQRDLSEVIEDLRPDTTHIYAVTAVDYAGNESAAEQPGGGQDAQIASTAPPERVSGPRRRLAAAPAGCSHGSRHV